MKRISFYLKRPKAQTPQSVFAVYCFAGKKFKLYTGVSVRPRDWNLNRQRVKGSAGNAALFNDRLDRIEHDIVAIVIQLENERLTPSIDAVRLRYQKLYPSRTDRKDSGKDFLDYFSDWIEANQNSRRSLTLRNYESTKTHLKTFAEQQLYQLHFERMDRFFIESFTRYLMETAKIQNSTIWQHIKTWKTFMGWAVEQGLTENHFHESVTKKLFSVHEPDTIRLTEEELKRVAEVNLTDERLNNARNLFVLQCSLGVRFGDLVKIVEHPDAYREGNSIRLTTEKNRKPVLIPLLPAARKILDGDFHLRPISNQKLNAYIKEVAGIAKLHRKVTISKFRGAKREDQVEKLSEIITSHTAKRTFISMMAAHGISRDVIKAVTGNSEATLDRYLKLNESEISREMLKASKVLE